VGLGLREGGWEGGREGGRDSGLRTVVNGVLQAVQAISLLQKCATADEAVEVIDVDKMWEGGLEGEKRAERDGAEAGRAGEGKDQDHISDCLGWERTRNTAGSENVLFSPGNPGGYPPLSPSPSLPPSLPPYLGLQVLDLGNNFLGGDTFPHLPPPLPSPFSPYLSGSAEGVTDRDALEDSTFTAQQSEGGIEGGRGEGRMAPASPLRRVHRRSKTRRRLAPGGVEGGRTMKEGGRDGRADPFKSLRPLLRHLPFLRSLSLSHCFLDGAQGHLDSLCDAFLPSFSFSSSAQTPLAPSLPALHPSSPFSSLYSSSASPAFSRLSSLDLSRNPRLLPPAHRPSLAPQRLSTAVSHCSREMEFTGDEAVGEHAEDKGEGTALVARRGSNNPQESYVGSEKRAGPQRTVSWRCHGSFQKDGTESPPPKTTRSASPHLSFPPSPTALPLLLQRLPHLRSLSLSHCRLGDDGILLLLPALISLPLLEQLFLANNELSSAGIQELACMLAGDGETGKGQGAGQGIKKADGGRIMHSQGVVKEGGRATETPRPTKENQKEHGGEDGGSHDESSQGEWYSPQCEAKADDVHVLAGKNAGEKPASVPQQGGKGKGRGGTILLPSLTALDVYGNAGGSLGVMALCRCLQRRRDRWEEKKREDGRLIVDMRHNGTTLEDARKIVEMMMEGRSLAGYQITVRTGFV